MTTNDQNKGTDPQEPRKKGGGDGKAKSAEPKSQPGQATPEATPSAEAGEAGVRSRKITTSRR